MKNRNNICGCKSKIRRCDTPSRTQFTVTTSQSGAVTKDIVIRSTTADSDGDTRAVVSREGGTTFLDFHVPRGGMNTIQAGNVETVSPDESASVTDRYENDKHYLDFKIPRGETGAKGEQGVSGPKGDKGERGEVGPPGPEDIPASFIISYNDDPVSFPKEGKEIVSGGRLPLMRLELDNGGILELDNNDNSIQFKKTGVYLVTFTVNAYVKKSGVDFNPDTDFVSIAFKEFGEDNILAASNSWSKDEYAVNMVGQGIFVVADITKTYELVNVQKKSIYINGCNIMQTVSQSYFSVPMVSMTFVKLV